MADSLLPISWTSSVSQLSLLIGAAAVLLPVIVLTASPGRTMRYLQRKRYQYEVTFSLYMMTPTEKFIFNSILFLFVAMVLIAAALYLPANVAAVAGRAWYYLGGDDAGAARAGAADTLSVAGKESVAASISAATAAPPSAIPPAVAT